MTDIEFLAINDHSRMSQAHYNRLRRAVSFPVYQDQQTTDIWNTLNGEKDDFFIYDRCGRLTYYLPLPHSDLTRPTTTQAITSTYVDRPCGYCAEDPPDTENDAHEDGDVGTNTDGHAAPTNDDNATSQVNAADLHNTHSHHSSMNDSKEMNLTADDTERGADTEAPTEFAVGSEVENVAAVNNADVEEPSMFTRLLKYIRGFFSDQEENRVSSLRDHRGDPITKQ